MLNRTIIKAFAKKARSLKGTITHSLNERDVFINHIINVFKELQPSFNEEMFKQECMPRNSALYKAGPKPN